jgi:hypothetical protein
MSDEALDDPVGDAVPYEPDVSSGDVVEVDELDAEIADDDGMAGTAEHLASAVGPAQESEAIGEEVEHDAGPDDDADLEHDASSDHDADLEHDATVDAELDSWDDGGVAACRSEPVSGALPFVVSAREEFAALGEVPVTGDARVDAATARLDEVTDLPTAEHVGVYDDVHRRLQDALADADAR